jgi:hypothetical protein
MYKLCNFFNFMEKGSTKILLTWIIFVWNISSRSKTYNAMQFLDRQGIITLSQEFSEKFCYNL